ncbi:MAG: AtpZ/AtpI family protein [Rhodospirillales bacterium]|jgi:ATP synthase protein I|nr:AtpZ/AtpI family protein [Rhodospirillales bacterium]MDP6803882.1 AtpZ/AtpI family protein [Rhodospirillales bacterium]
MEHGKSAEPLKDLDERLRRAKAEGEAPAKAGPAESQASMSGLGLAFRIGTELVAALVVGVGLGLVLDHWLGTAPWLLVVFFFMGAATGILNVYRVASGIGLTPGTQTSTASGPGAEKTNGRTDTPVTREQRSGENAIGSGDSPREEHRGESA